MIEIRSPQTPEDFQHYYFVRWKTLREPWNQPPGSEKDDQEENSIHLMATENNVVLGVCRLQFNNENQSQVRFMGVSEAARDKGVGRLLLSEAEKISKSNNCSELILQARDYAVPFYEKCGYTVREKTFLLWDEIQHYLMYKNL